MSAVLASVCTTLIILAFCQVLVEAVLPEGSTKRYVTFIAGLVTVAAVIGIFSMSRQELAKLVFTKTQDLQQMAQAEQAAMQPAQDPYREYLEKLIDTYR